MPRIRSAKKKLRQTKTHAKLNRAQRSAIRTAVKKARATPTAESVLEAIRALDRGARKRQIHPNAAARKKARLQRQLAKTKAQG